ncbi:MAG: hypothetical protein IRZ01_04900 [Thermoflavifilum aggregans]|nr:hypothetical protein [Thermoflavifilum aggregans]
MNSNPELPENYFRVFRSLAQLIEEKLMEMEMSFVRFQQPTRVHLEYQYDLDEADCNRIKQVIGRMYQELEVFVNRYQIPPRSFSLRKQLLVQNSFLWEDLENSRSKRIRGYGAVNDVLMQELDTFLDHLIMFSNQISDICQGNLKENIQNG